MLNFLEEWKSILWLGAGCDIRAPITPIIDIIEKEGIFLVQGQDLDMTQWIHNKTLEFMNKSKNNYIGKYSFAGGIQGHLLNSKNNSLIKFQKELALNPNCICPNGSSLRNHRYDQSILSILAHDMELNSYTKYLAASRSQLVKNPLKPSKQIIWTARGRSRDYINYIYN